MKWMIVSSQKLTIFAKEEKKVAHPFVSLQIIPYICIVAQDAARHIEEAFGYSTSVNLDNSLVCLEYRNALLGYDIYDTSYIQPKV